MSVRTLSEWHPVSSCRGRWFFDSLLTRWLFFFSGRTFASCIVLRLDRTCDPFASRIFICYCNLHAHLTIRDDRRGSERASSTRHTLRALSHQVTWTFAPSPFMRLPPLAMATSHPHRSALARALASGSGPVHCVGQSRLRPAIRQYRRPIACNVRRIDCES